MGVKSWASWAVAATALFRSVAVVYGESACRYLPGDAEWPSVDEWNQLNTSVSGRLIAAVPEGHVCHDPTYDETACAALQSNWIMPDAQ